MSLIRHLTSHYRRRPRFLPFLFASASLACAVYPATASDELLQMSLEDLMSMQVTGVNKRAEPLGKAAAAVFVLTAEDIRRSGARTIAQALRLVPGLHVAQTNAQSYLVASRGFNQSSSGKLEVVIDGRSAYTPLNATVFWDVLDTYLPDIERIEVIRGPGGTVWGANAVNGVINIVTRSASETVGQVLTVGGGTQERGFASFRSGAKVGKNGHVRFYAKALERSALELEGGRPASDGQVLRQGGLRSDWNLSDGGQMTGSADIYQGDSSDQNGPTEVRGGNAALGWSRKWMEGANTSARLSLDTYDRQIPGVYGEERETLDLELQHNLAAIGRHQFTVGAGFRFTSDETAGPPAVVIFAPQNRSTRKFSGFVQDRISFAAGRGTLDLGSKIEHNDYSGTEWQPGLRLGWEFNQSWYGWGAIARAVRTPTRLDHDVALFCAAQFAAILGCTPGTILPQGSPNFESETLLAYELGIRGNATDELLLELAVFFNDYSDLRSRESAGFTSGFENRFKGVGYGGETNLRWRPHKNFSLNAYYSYLEIDLDPPQGNADFTTEGTVEGSSPAHQAGLVASWNIAPRWLATSQLRYVDELAHGSVPAYTELDLGLRWQMRPTVDLFLAGQNLLDSRHPEFGELPDRPEVVRGVYASLTWRWE